MRDDGSDGHDQGRTDHGAGSPDFARAPVRGGGDPLKKTLPLQLLHRDESANSGVRRLDESEPALDGSSATPKAIPAPPDTLRSLAPPPPGGGAKPASPASSAGAARGLGGTMMGHPGLSKPKPGTKPEAARPTTAPDESERFARHTDPGPVAAGQKRGPTPGARPRVQGEVSAAPVQQIGPKITISSSERPPIRRRTAPEPYRVIDAPVDADTVAETPTGQPVQARAERMRTPPGRPATAAPFGQGGESTAYPAVDESKHMRGRRSLPPELKRKRLMKDVGLLVGVAAVVGLAVIITEPSAQEEADPVVDEAEPLPGTLAGPPAASVQAATGPTTRIVTIPDGAEVLSGGAVVASTPAGLARPEYGGDYLVRKRGFMPQLVRLGPNSPETITIELKPAGGVPEETPAPTVAPEAPANP